MDSDDHDSYEDYEHCMVSCIANGWHTELYRYVIWIALMGILLMQSLFLHGLCITARLEPQCFKSLYSFAVFPQAARFLGQTPFSDLIEISSDRLGRLAWSLICCMISCLIWSMAVFAHPYVLHVLPD